MCHSRSPNDYSVGERLKVEQRTEKETGIFLGGIDAEGASLCEGVRV